MRKIYIAGKLNDDAVGYIKNLHIMCHWAEIVRQLGFAVFIPGIDFLMGFLMGNWEYADYFDNSQPWLAASDAVFVTPNHETSEGTMKEIAYAKSLDIPVFDSMADLAIWDWEENCNENKLGTYCVSRD